MPFNDVITAGKKLIQAAIQSPNYAMGAAGWSINADGSAEFQNVLVRGTITGSTIIGSTIMGGTIVAGIFKSSNFDNTAHTGFEINATASADTTATPPVPANTFQIYSDFIVGVVGGNFIELKFASSAAAMNLGTGNAADTLNAAVGSGTFVQSGSGRTISAMQLQSATENGFTAIQMFPSGGTLAADFPGEVLLFTQGTTAPAGHDGTTGRFFLGANGTTDIWQMICTSENSVIDAGPVIGNPAVVLGDTFTPRSRLFISVNELLTLDGTNTPEVLYLNTNNAQTVFAGVISPVMRGFHNGGTNVNMSTTSSTYNAPANTPSITATYPPSGVLKVEVHGGLGLNTTASGSFTVVSFEIRDTNSGGTLRQAASDNFSTSINGASFGGTAGVVPGSLSFIISGLPTTGTYFVRPMIRSSDNASTATLGRPVITTQPQF